MVKKSVLGLILTVSLVFNSHIFAQSQDEFKRQVVIEFLNNQNPEVVSRFYDLLRVMLIVQDNYVDVKSLEEILELAMKGAVNGLDPNSNLFLGEEASRLAESFTGEENYVGIGLQIEVINGTVIVMSVFDGSPAMDAGIEPGDFIRRVDKEDVWKKTAQEVAKKMRGPENTEVELEIFSRNFQQLKTIRVIRKHVVIASVVYEDNLLGNVGYIKIHAFTREAIERFRQALLSYFVSGKEGLIIDLRDNGGGLLDSVVYMLGFLIGPDKLVISQRSRDLNLVETKTKNDMVLPDTMVGSSKIVVLVNNFSASASEIMAGNLQYYDVATIVGVRTFGKASVQAYKDVDESEHDFKNTTMILGLTVARYLLPDGRDISAEGVAPNVEIEQKEGFRRYDYKTENDPQFYKAVELLRGNTVPQVKKESDRKKRKWFFFFMF